MPKKENKKNEIVSAYDEDGNPKKESGRPKLTTRYKVLYFVFYAIGLAASLGVIFLLERCSSWFLMVFAIMLKRVNLRQYEDKEYERKHI